MARPRADDVRRLVLLEAFAQIADRGVDGMSMRTLAGATGLSMGTITYHFNNKRQLLLDAIAYGYQRPPAGMREGDIVGNLRSLVRRYDLSTERRRTWWRFWVAVVTHAQKDEEVRALLAEQHRSAVGRFHKLIDDGIAAGLIENVDSASAAERLVAHAHGLAVAQLVDPSCSDVLREGLTALLEPILR